MSRTQSFVFALLILFVSLSDAQRIKYLNGIRENESCEYEKGIVGTCRKITDCVKTFEAYRNNQIVLQVCAFERSPAHNIICCPNSPENSNFGNRMRGASNPVHTPDLLDFKVCRNEFLKYRNHSINPNHFARAMESGKIPTDKNNCEYLDTLNKLSELEKKVPLDLKFYKCKMVDGKYELTVVAAFYAVLVERGDRPNMAAIGWTRSNGTVEYKCGGSIVTERFIVTAAHCKFFEGKQADTVRLGDRFLITSEDDDIAQQLGIEKFIIHPDYRSRYNYNDIAMIKTTHKIIFNKFVVPSCIDDLDSESVGYFTEWTVAGYGETEDRVPSNVLLELKVDLVSYEECNKTYEFDPSLPYGIIPSQFCVKSKPWGENIPDTCFGDSGSPLQFKTSYEILDEDFNTTYLSTVYHTSTVLGIVSFGLDCGFNVPSVYTKLAYFKNWMRSVIKHN